VMWTTRPDLTARGMNYRSWTLELRQFKHNIIQESRAAARKPRNAASVLFCWSSPTTFTTSIRLAKLQKRPSFGSSELQTCWRKTQF